MNQKLQKKIKNLESIERLPAEEFFKFLQLDKEDALLDLGAGAGYISLSIADCVKKVVALDFDKEVLGYLESKARDKGITNIETASGDFRAMPLANNGFNKAVASISLHEVTPLSSVLKEIHRVLMDKGLFLCIDIEKSERPTGPRVSSAEMESEIRKAGFSIKETVHSSTQIANQPVYIIVAQKNE